MTISTRSFVKIMSLSAGVVVVLVIFSGFNYGRAVKAERSVENSYMRAVQELSLNIDNIKNNLEKGMYSNSPQMMSTLSEKLCSDAATAKTALSQLPVEELDLTNTYRFLSQVGNYSKSLAEKCANGEVLTDSEKSNIKKLFSYATDLSGNMWAVERKIQKGEISLNTAVSAARSMDAEAPQTVTDGFSDIATADNSFPTLIYDGPFSDHIMNKEPVMLKNASEITKEAAFNTAVRIAGTRNLSDGGEETGKMPCYVFSGENVSVAITKRGGMCAYKLKNRHIGSQELSVSKAIEIGEEYLETYGINNLEDSYYEVKDGLCIINYAAEQNDVILYTDLVKVGVALDNGEVLSFDMRGYINNHYIRDIPEPKLTEEQAEGMVSKELIVNDANLCLIPSEGMNEIFCYEVSCIGKEGRNILVYINAETGEEERILLLDIGSGGVLTV